MGSMDVSSLCQDLLREKEANYRNGIYGYTQRKLAYNSNKIEGSTLTEEQTASLFDEGVLAVSDTYYRAKDIEEMSGHFLMFNKMLSTMEQPLSQDLIKAFHYELKSGVFEDRANGYAIGDYKKIPNFVGNHKTALPADVPEEMEALLQWYNGQEKHTRTFAEFHLRYERLHPFQDGNGRTGRLIAYRECLKNHVMPLIIEDRNRKRYIEAFNDYYETDSVEAMAELFQEEQAVYENDCRYFYDNQIP